MSYSRSPVRHVLMYDTKADRAFWVQPWESYILLNVYPHYERIDPDEACYEQILKIAPPYPVIYPPSPPEGPRED